MAEWNDVTFDPFFSLDDTFFSLNDSPHATDSNVGQGYGSALDADTSFDSSSASPTSLLTGGAFGSSVLSHDGPSQHQTPGDVAEPPDQLDWAPYGSLGQSLETPSGLSQQQYENQNNNTASVSGGIAPLSGVELPHQQYASLNNNIASLGGGIAPLSGVELPHQQYENPNNNIASVSGGIAPLIGVELPHQQYENPDNNIASMGGSVAPLNPSLNSSQLWLTAGLSRKRPREPAAFGPSEAAPRRQKSFHNTALPVGLKKPENYADTNNSLGNSVQASRQTRPASALSGGIDSTSTSFNPAVVIDLTGDDDAFESPILTRNGFDRFPELAQAFRGSRSKPDSSLSHQPMMTEDELARLIYSYTNAQLMPNIPDNKRQNSGQPSWSDPNSALAMYPPSLNAAASAQRSHVLDQATTSQSSSDARDGPPNQDVSALIDSIHADVTVPPHLREKTPPQMSSELMEHQKIGLGWLKRQEESSFRGGILADDMGLGKTVEAIALILARPSNNPICKTTLIVAPLSLMRQWEVELKRHIRADHHLKVFVYHGNIRNVDFDRLRTHDVVLTTFHTLASEIGRLAEARTLLTSSGTWYRVILDEAHAIRTRNTLASRAVHELRATYRLCMTGTPLMNSIGELFPYLRFLRIGAYKEFHQFSNHILKPLKDKGRRGTAMGRVQTLLKPIMLRRQKSTVIDGKPICVIPPKHIHHHNVVLSPYELAFYKEIETKGQAVINRFLMRTSPAKYSTVLLFLLRLRQTCCHTHLITHLTSEDFTPAISEEDLITYAKKLDEDVIGRLREHFDAECPICFDVAVNATIFIPCGHGCCGECTSKLFDENARGQDPTCPQCRGPLNRQSITDYKHFCQVHCPDQWEGHTDVNGRFSQGIDNDDHDSDDSDGDEVDDSGNLAGFVVPDDSEGENRRTDRRRRTPKKTLAELRNAAQRSKEAKRKYLKRLKKDYVGSSKLNKALEILGKIRGEDPTEKTIIFSQFTSLLDLMEIPLQRGGYKYQRYDGGMKMNERAEAVAQFMDSPDVNIILISLKAGNSGLNLSNSSQVIMLDPFWNPFVEDQAVDRAHRMMQKREVHVHRLLVPNTVEDRILQLQENKRELIGHAMSEGGSGAAGGGLTREELRFLFFGQPNN